MDLNLRRFDHSKERLHDLFLFFHADPFVNRFSVTTTGLKSRRHKASAMSSAIAARQGRTRRLDSG